MSENGSFIAELIGASPRGFAAGAVSRQRARESGGAPGHDLPVELVEDTEVRLQYLMAALAVDRPMLFHQHLEWSRIAYAAREIPLSMLTGNLEALREEFDASLPPACAPTVAEVLTEGVRRVEAASDAPVSELEGNGDLVDLVRHYLLAALEGRERDAVQLILDQRDRGVADSVLRSEVLCLAQKEAGRMWQMGEISISDEHYISRISESVLAALDRAAPSQPSTGRRVLVTSVAGDLHEIGLRVVKQEFEAHGWDVVFLGANTPAEDVVGSVLAMDIDALAVGATLATHVRGVADLIKQLRASGSTVPVVVGGPLFSLVPDLGEAVGADGSAGDANTAVRAADRLVAC